MSPMEVNEFPVKSQNGVVSLFGSYHLLSCTNDVYVFLDSYRRQKYASIEGSGIKIGLYLEYFSEGQS